MARQTMNELAVKYFKMRKHVVKKSTLVCEESTVGKLCRWWDQTRRVPASLGDEEMEDYLFGPGGLAERVTPASFNTQLSQMRRFVTWAVRRKAMSGDLLDVMRSVPAARKEYLRVGLAQIHTMIEMCDDEWERWVLTVASQTFGRDGELRSLRLRDFNLDTGLVAFKRHKTDDVDEMPITSALEAGYRRWVTFYSNTVGKPYSGDWFAIPYRAWGNPSSLADVGGHDGWAYIATQRRAGGLSQIVQSHVARLLQIDQDDLKGQGVHIVRRSMARALYDKLVETGHPDPLRMVMTMLGHASPAVTERYLGIKPDRVRRNALLAGSDILSVPTTNVIDLRKVANG